MLDIIHQRIKCHKISTWTCDIARLSIDPMYDCFPNTDVWLANKLKKLFKLSQRPTPSDVDHLTKGWSPYRGFIAWHLWRDF